jgi:hypothetical protein
LPQAHEAISKTELRMNDAPIKFMSHARFQSGEGNSSGKVPLSFLDYAFRQPPNEQSRERLCLLKTHSVRHCREVDGMHTVEDAANPYTAASAEVLFRMNK